MQETPGKGNRTEGVTETSGGFSIYIRRRIDTKAWWMTMGVPVFRDTIVIKDQMWKSLDRWQNQG